MRLTAAPSDTPGRRLNDTATAGSCTCRADGARRADAGSRAKYEKETGGEGDSRPEGAWVRRGVSGRALRPPTRPPVPPSVTLFAWMGGVEKTTERAPSIPPDLV